MVPLTLLSRDNTFQEITISFEITSKFSDVQAALGHFVSQDIRYVGPSYIRLYHNSLRLQPVETIDRTDLKFGGDLQWEFSQDTRKEDIGPSIYSLFHENLEFAFENAAFEFC